MVNLVEILGKCNLKTSKEVQNNWLPFYSGELACGLFGISEDYVDSYLSLDEKFMKNKEATFFVRASGDSMSPEIKQDDILVVDRSLAPADLSIAALFFNGDPLCKQLSMTHSQIRLKSFNSKYKEIIVKEDDELEIFGVVIGLVRDFI